ncbi:MAG: hypothetical protein DLM58_16285 [Pseudonocardiales bacterium]|nr:MAG: hypothetical protein DLM58_16285 [Pseudonocardiales bacterium]
MCALTLALLGDSIAHGQGAAREEDTSGARLATAAVLDVVDEDEVLPPASAIGVPPPSWQQIGATPSTVKPRNGRAVYSVIATVMLIAGAFALGFAVGNDTGTTIPAQAGNIPGGASSADAHPSAACLPADSGRCGRGHFRFNTSACENGTTEVTAFPWAHSSACCRVSVVTAILR